jgi:hypothetical protein
MPQNNSRYTVNANQVELDGEPHIVVQITLADTTVPIERKEALLDTAETQLLSMATMVPFGEGMSAFIMTANTLKLLTPCSWKAGQNLLPDVRAALSARFGCDIGDKIER